MQGRTCFHHHLTVQVVVIISTMAAAVELGDASTGPFMGWFGPYHPTSANLPDGSNRSVWETFRFGQAAVMNSPSDGGWPLENDLQFHCSEHDVNSIMGMLLPPTEGGVVNNPNDTSLLEPATSSPGLVQGAARFSQLSMSHCPQLTGVVIDGTLNCVQGENVRRWRPIYFLDFRLCVLVGPECMLPSCMMRKQHHQHSPHNKTSSFWWLFLLLLLCGQCLGGRLPHQLRREPDRVREVPVLQASSVRQPKRRAILLPMGDRAQSLCCSATATCTYDATCGGQGQRSSPSTS